MVMIEIFQMYALGNHHLSGAIVTWFRASMKTMVGLVFGLFNAPHVIWAASSKSFGILLSYRNIQKRRFLDHC